MADSHFLFLGYSMRDWNLRVILSRIWGAPAARPASRGRCSASPPTPGAREVEEALWRDRGDVDLLYVPSASTSRGSRTSSFRRPRMTDGRDRAARHRPETPYVGLVPYGEEDADFFFGRDDERRIVTGNLRASRLTILYGPSGVGKTSLLQAGVVHDLREQVVAARTPARRRRRRSRSARSAPGATTRCRALMDAMHDAAVEASARGELRAWQPGESVVETLRAWTEAVQTLLVVLDQFEDYFLYHGDEERRRHVRRRVPGDRQRRRTCASTSCSRSARTPGRSSTASRGGSRTSSGTTFASSI